MHVHVVLRFCSIIILNNIINEIVLNCIEQCRI